MNEQTTQRLLSLGAGVQSTTLALMSAEGRLPRLDGAIFADTGWEPARVYEHLARVEQVLTEAAGRRCGNCFHRRTLAWRARSYPKCCFPEGEGPEDLELLGPPRASHGAATDCRSWWPGCVDHVYGEPSLSPDAARWVPEATA